MIYSAKSHVKKMSGSCFTNIYKGGKRKGKKKTNWAMQQARCDSGDEKLPSVDLRSRGVVV